MKKYIFGSWEPFSTDNEKEVVRTRLYEWKNSLLKKLPEFAFVEEAIVEREIPFHDMMITNPKGTLALKICLEGPNDYNFEPEGNIL